MVQFNIDDSATMLGIVRKIMCAEIGVKRQILNVAASFDTETTSFYHEVSGDEIGLVYVWMFGIQDEVVYGRTMDEFRQFLYIVNSMLVSQGVRLIVYVHNLKYDFQFIKEYVEWNEVFMKRKREPLYARVGNIEFRDSLILAGGRSLAYIGEHLKTHTVRKAVGDLDYNLKRHCKTPLTEQELHYCENDILTLNAYIEEKIEEEGDISRIPYTNTGYVRRFVKNETIGKMGDSYREIIDNLTLTPGAYQQCENAFIGGAVGANPTMVGEVHCNVKSYDIKSSYPYVMATQSFPMGFPTPVRNEDAWRYLDSNLYHCIFRIHVENIAPKEGNNYCYPISQDKCRTLLGERVVSNRVKQASYLVTDITELDWDTYQKFYNVSRENTRITHMRVYPKGRLPESIVRSVFEFFNKKTTLDGVEGRESEYMLSKNMLNSIYGMCVERPVRPKYIYYNGGVFKDDIDYVRQVEDYNNNRDRFLFYPWGVYVTAWARHRLYDAIYAVGDRYVYCDTDSVKYLYVDDERDAEIEAYFARINWEAKYAIVSTAKRMKLNLDFVIPKSPSGEEKVLGVWEHEYTAKYFKTLGPKRYLYTDGNGKNHLTVAGCNKKGALEYLEKYANETGKSIFDLFDMGLTIPAEYAKRLVATYVDEQRMGYMTDYLGNREFFSCLSGIHMAPSNYRFNITEDLREELLRLLTMADEDLGEIEE